ncbi:hypothetical protein M407DRAFT_26680 [Tulasnella calospora MUT 4182]|uniref:Flavoprotein domain-containing protein n=1 Tax=Tulasnella calospora MUT 4182 TaxID=1051891 RepID=A0A0C3QDX0_9AGAM|nr:hypothetical protein M407DRAFT_26680 [Tulasnella calospora MUT 4182]
MAEQFKAAESRVPGSVHVLLITTGSVASIKARLIVEKLLEYQDVQIQVVATKSSLVFYNRDNIDKLSATSDGRQVRVWTDDDEWSSWKKVGDPLRRWADVVLIAPCSANTLAKIAGGICDNLVTSLLRALDPSTPTFVFPAMNTMMYNHPLTAIHLKTVQEVIGYTVVGPIGKNLACGDVGVGAMTEWTDIVKLVVERWHLELARKQAGTSVV